MSPSCNRGQLSRARKTRSQKNAGEPGLRSRLLKGESVKIASERSLTPASAATQISHIVVEIDRGIELVPGPELRLR